MIIRASCSKVEAENENSDKICSRRKNNYFKSYRRRKNCCFFLTVQKKVAFQFFMSKMYIKINVKNNKTK